MSLTLKEEQVHDFREQMDVLRDAQTTFEKLKADVKTQPTLYYPVQELVMAKVTAAEKYVTSWRSGRTNPMRSRWELFSGKSKASRTLRSISALRGKPEG